MKVSRLSADQPGGGYNVLVEFDYTDLTGTAGLTKTLALTESGFDDVYNVVTKAALVVDTAFAGTTTLVAEVGDSGDTDRFLASSNLMAAAGTISALVPATAPAAVVGTKIIGILVTATGSNLTALTAGAARLYLSLAEFGPA